MTGLVYGYARVSTRDQNPQLQLEALSAAGCDEVLEEVGSGGRSVAGRPVLAALLPSLQAGDELVVWRLDRLGRRSGEIILTVDALRERGVLLRSLTEGLDGRTPTGRAMLGMVAIFAQLEREILLERVRAGIEISRREGRHGRPRTWDPEQVTHARQLIEGGASVRKAARLVGLPRSTLGDALTRITPNAPL